MRFIKNKTLNVKIPKGIAEGQQIRLAGQGLPGYNGGENGDLYLKIKFHDQPDLYVKNRKDVYQTIDANLGKPYWAAKSSSLPLQAAYRSICLPTAKAVKASASKAKVFLQKKPETFISISALMFRQ